MKSIRKILLVTLVLMALILTIGLVGCGTSEDTTQQTTTNTTSSPVETTTTSTAASTTPAQTSTTPPVTTTSEAPSTTEQVSAGMAVAGNAVEAATGVTTFKMYMEMDMSTVTEVQGQTVDVDMDMIADAEMDLAEQELKMVMDMVMDVPYVGEQTVSSSIYMTGGWMYMLIDIPGQGEQWVKMQCDESEWDEQDQFTQQIDLLDSATGAEIVGTETVNGVLCDVILLEPDMATLGEWAMAQQSDDTAEQLGDVDLSDVFKSFSVKYWIAQDSSLPIKCEMNIVMEMTAEDLGDTSGTLDSMTMEMNAMILFYDYGEPVDTALPPAAAGAMEIDSE